MGHKAPRYDIPKAAPAPLSLVQGFVNTINSESGEEWLDRWLEAQGVRPTTFALRRARLAREALRRLLAANNRQPIEGQPWEALTAAADSAQLSIDFGSQALVSRAQGVNRAVGDVLAAAFNAMAAGEWRRLKTCRNCHCRWAFYDYSKNASATWCSMQLCGNRQKTRAYRAKRRR